MVRNPFSYEHLSRFALFMETHQPRLAQLFSTEEGDTADTAGGVHGLPGERRTCADRRILRDGLLMRSDIMVWSKGF